MSESTRPRTPRPRRRLAIASIALAIVFGGGAIASAVPIGVAHVAAAGRVDKAKRIGDKAEAWYSTAASLCLPLIGCVSSPIALPSVYPAGTLHVGAIAGSASARSYVVPALSDLTKPKPNKVPHTGKLVLPVDSSLLAGTLGLTSAHIKACLVTGKLPAKPSTTAATSGPRPAIDCRTSASARYDSASKTFEVDLAHFLTKWRNGVAERGIALIPVVTSAATWQVTFDGKQATGNSVYSLIGYPSCHACKLPLPSSSPTPSTNPAAAPPPFDLPPVPVTVLPSAPAPQVAPPSAASVYLVRAEGFRYPAIFVAPLAILAGVIFFGRLFTGTTFRPRPIPVGLGRSKPAPPTDGS